MEQRIPDILFRENSSAGNQPMAMQATAVDLLMNKGEFEPQVALAIAEAVAVTMTETQVVTLPALDARVATLDARMAALDHRIDLVDHKIDLVESRLEKKIDLVKMDLENKIETAKMELERKIESVKMDLKTAVGRLEKAIEVSSATTKAELIRWVFVTMIGSVFLQSVSAAMVNALMRH